MNARDYLKEVKMLPCDIARVSASIKQLESILGLQGIAYDGEHFTKTDIFADASLTPHVYELMEKREYFEVTLGHYLSKLDEANYIVSSISSSKQQMAVILYYIEGMSYNKAGDEMGYDGENVRKLCSAAIEKLDGNLIGLIQDFKRVAKTCH